MNNHDPESFDLDDMEIEMSEIVARLHRSAIDQQHCPHCHSQMVIMGLALKTIPTLDLRIKPMMQVAVADAFRKEINHDAD